MASILIVGDDIALVQSQTELLERAGHRVEAAGNPFQARERLAGAACDFVLIDVRRPDGGMGLLIEQTRAAWPQCKVIAMVRPVDPHHSKVHKMGLWTPDLELTHPITPDDLLAALS